MYVLWVLTIFCWPITPQMVYPCDHLRLKMATNKSWNKNFAQSIGEFFFWVDRGLLFPSNSQCVPQDVSNSITFSSHMFCPKFSPYIIGPNRRHYVYRIFYYGELPKFQFFFVIGQWKLFNTTQKKKELGKHHPFNQFKDEYTPILPM
jgi:hypothetical protein